VAVAIPPGESEESDGARGHADRVDTEGGGALAGARCHGAARDPQLLGLLRRRRGHPPAAPQYWPIPGADNSQENQVRKPSFEATEPEDRAPPVGVEAGPAKVRG